MSSPHIGETKAGTDVRRRPGRRPARNLGRREACATRNRGMAEIYSANDIAISSTAPKILLSDACYTVDQMHLACYRAIGDVKSRPPVWATADRQTACIIGRDTEGSLHRTPSRTGSLRRARSEGRTAALSPTTAVTAADHAAHHNAGTRPCCSVLIP